MQQHDNLIGGEWTRGSAYSPNLNPTELVLAKFKTLLCKADKRSIAAMV